MRISEIMTRNVVTVGPDDPLSLAVQTMRWSGVRSLPVLQKEQIIGVLGEDDVLRFQLALDDSSPLSHLVREAMVDPRPTFGPDAQVSDVAAELVRRKYSAGLIVENKKLVGVVSALDLLRMQPEHGTLQQGHPSDLCAEDLMTPEPMTAHPDDRLLDAASKMAQFGVRHLPVVDGEGVFLGMLSEHDLGLPREGMEIGLGRQAPLATQNMKVEAVMQRNVVSMLPDASLSALVSACVDWRVGAVPVLDEEDQLLGIISYIDVLRTLWAEHEATRVAAERA
jgi:CBS domain-containing protein